MSTKSGLQEMNEALAPIVAHNATLAKQVEVLREALTRLIDSYNVSHSPDIRAACWDQARAALEDTKP